MDFINKRVDSVTLTKFHPTKEWTVQLSETSSYGIKVISSSYSELTNINSFTETNNIYYMVNRMFYEQGKSAYYYSSRDIDNKDIKFLYPETSIIFIPKNVFGDRIRAGSMQISSSANTIKISDNYDGQLIDDNATSIVSDTNLVGWWSFDDGYKTNSVQATYNSTSKIQDSLPMHISNAKFTTGIQNIRHAATFDGTGYGTVEEYSYIKFEKSSNFAISFWLNIPVSQSIVSSSYNTIISKGSELERKYPFKIDLYNHTDTTNTRKLRAYRKDKFGETVITSSALTAGQFNHIVFQKTGSLLYLYVNNTLESSASDSTNTNTYFTDEVSNLFIGGYASSSREGVPELSGSVDELRIYNKGLTTTEIGYLHSNPYNTNIIGNVYYKHGIVVINNQSGSYNTVYKSSSDKLKYESVIEVKELRVELTKTANEFNFTLNPSVFVKAKSFDQKELISSISSSFNDFSPYITTIGLMNAEQEVLAVAKLKKPLKSNQDLPIKFVIRMDV